MMMMNKGRKQWNHYSSRPTSRFLLLQQLLLLMPFLLLFRSSFASSSNLPNEANDAAAIITNGSITTKQRSNSNIILFNHDNEEESNISLANSIIGTFSRKLMENKLSDDINEELSSSTTISQPTHQHYSLRRYLADGDWDEFNEMLKNAIIKIPLEFEYSDRIAFIPMKFWASGLRCYNINIGDILINHTYENDQRLTFDISIEQLELECNVEYFNYDYIWNGDGSIYVNTGENNASVQLAFTSSSFKESPPTNSNVTKCDATISITDLDFSGGLDATILNPIDKPLRSLIANQVDDVACKELGSLGTTFVKDFLDIAKDAIDPYLNSEEVIIDPLRPENNLVVPDDIELLNLQDTKNTIGGWFNMILEEVDTLLGDEVKDSDAPDGTGYDLGINTFIRQYLLEDDRSFVLDINTVFKDGLILFDGHDQITETTISLEKVKLWGLDTFTKFKPIIDIGKYTLQNEMSWEYLTVELDIIIDIKPSTKDDSIIETPDKKLIKEKVQVKFGVDELDAIVSLLLAIDINKIKDLQIGPLMNIKNILPCLLSTIFKIELSELYVWVDNIQEPTLEGFVSGGIDRLITDSVNAVFMMYKPTLQKAMPIIFQTKVKDVINDNIINKYWSDNKDKQCTSSSMLDDDDWEGETVDFRDLFMKPEDAIEHGGTGSEPYGDVVPTIYSLLTDQMSSLDNDDGLPKINSMVIRPATKSLSGVEGTLQVASDIFSFLVTNGTGGVDVFGLDNIELRLFDAIVENIDSVGSPLVLLEPNTTSGNLLNNQVKLGAGSKPIKGQVSVLLALSGDPVLETTNELNVSIEIENADVFAVVLAKMVTNRLLSFPLRDLTNIDCWLSTFIIPELDDDTGYRVKGVDPSLAIDYMSLAFSMLRFNMTCGSGSGADPSSSSCDSAGFAALPDIIATLDKVGTVQELQTRLVDLAIELANSEYIQVQIDRFLVDSSRKCPHSPDYDDDDTAINGTTVVANYGKPSFPSLSRDSFESLVYAASVFAEVAIVIIAEHHSNYTLEKSDPLSAQETLDVTDDVRLLDFTNLGDVVGSWADTALDEANTYFNRVIYDPNGPNADNGGTDIEINAMLRSFLLDDNGALTLSFDDLVIGGDGEESGSSQIALSEVRIMGLDTISEINVLDAIAEQTLMNTFELKHLKVEVDVLIKTDNSPDDVLATAPGSTRRSLQEEQETMTLSFGINDISASVALLVALDLDRIGAIEFGSILHTNQILSCIVSTARAVEVTELNVNVGSIDELSVDGYVSEDVRMAISNATGAIIDEYGSMVIDSIPAVFGVTVRTLINNWLEYYMEQESSVSCPSSATDQQMDAFVDFRDLLLKPDMSLELGGTGRSQYGDLMHIIFDLVSDELFNTNDDDGTMLPVNNILIEPLTKAQSNTTGALIFPGSIIDSTANVAVGGLNANIEFKLHNIRIENLNTAAEPFDVIRPIQDDPSTLNNTATFGVGEENLRIVTSLLIVLQDGGDMQVRNDVDISLDVNSATVVLTALFKILEKSFLSFPLKDILNFDCWLSTIPAPQLDSRGIRVAGTDPTAALKDLAVSLAKLNLNVTCRSCSSPGLEDLAMLLSSPEAIEDATRAANNALDYVTHLLGGDFLQNQIDRMLNDANRKCPHSRNFDPKFSSVKYDPIEPPEQRNEAIQFLIVIIVTTVCLAGVVLIILSIVKWIVRRRHRKWLRSLPSDEIFDIYKEQTKEADINVLTKSMFASPVIAWYVRYSMPIIILGNIGFFISGHLNLGGTVIIQATFAGESFTVDNFFDFSMAKSTIDIWNAGGKELAILILIFSGIWPYTKQLITLVLWFLPPQVLSVSLRGRIFLLLDALAKWSMIDIFVLAITTAAFRVTIESPDVKFLPEGFYSIDLAVVPLWGLYANMIAQLISQISSHYIIHYHRRIAKVAEQEYEQRHRDVESLSTGGIDQDCQQHTQDDSRDKLCNHAFVRAHRVESHKLVVHRGINKAILAAALAILVLVVLGCTFPSFSVEVLGIIGVAVESGQDFEAAVRYHSIFSVVGLLFEEAKFLGTAGSYIGLTILSMLFIFTTLIVPLVQSLVLLRHWFRPLTGKERRKYAVWIEILQAWQYCEVYVIAVIVAAWQLAPVSDYMINAYCDGLTNVFASLVYFGILEQNDAQCFQVQTRVESGAYILIAGSVILALLNTFIMKAVFQYSVDMDRSEQQEREPKPLDEYEENADLASTIKKIHPVPVMFTDTFRWLLRRESAGDSTVVPVAPNTLFLENDDEFVDNDDVPSNANNGEPEEFVVDTHLSNSERDLSVGEVTEGTIEEGCIGGGEAREKWVNFGSKENGSTSADAESMETGAVLPYSQRERQSGNDHEWADEDGPQGGEHGQVGDEWGDVAESDVAESEDTAVVSNTETSSVFRNKLLI